MRAVELVIEIGAKGIIADAGTYVETPACRPVGNGIVVIRNRNRGIAEEFRRKLVVPAERAYFISPGKIEIKTVLAVKAKNIVAVISRKEQFVFRPDLKICLTIQVVKIVIRNRVEIFGAI